MWGLFVLPMAWMALVSPADDPDRRVMALMSVILTLICLPFFGILWQSRLVLTPEGIAHHQLGYTVRSTWANLEAIHLERGSQALYLEVPGTRSRLLRLAAGAVGGAMPGMESVIGNPQMLAQGRAIMLFPFMQHWKRGPLREDIERCAPHLFRK